jgi:hypothetical protein
MNSPTGFDWLWLPLERSIRHVLDSWPEEHYRLRRDVAFQVELDLERFLVDGHLTSAECEVEGRKVDLFVTIPNPMAPIAVYLSGGPAWMPAPLDIDSLKQDFGHIFNLTKIKDYAAGLILIFDEQSRPDPHPAYKQVAEEIAARLGYKYCLLTSDKGVVCHIWWIGNQSTTAKLEKNSPKANQEIASSLFFRQGLLELDALLIRNRDPKGWAQLTNRQVIEEAKAWDTKYTNLYDKAAPFDADLRFAACMAALLLCGARQDISWMSLLQIRYFGDHDDRRFGVFNFKKWEDAWNLGLELAKENNEVECLTEGTQGMKLFLETYKRWEVGGVTDEIQHSEPKGEGMWVETMRSRVE